MATSPPPLSLAVLPFINLSGDARNDALVDGITEQLMTKLAGLEDSVVMSREAALAYRGGGAEASAVGLELGVRFVIKGSVRTAGGGLRLNVQLIDATNNQPLWVERLDLETGDSLSMQREIVARLLPPLGAHLLTASGRAAQPAALAQQPAAARGEALLHPRGGTVVYPRGTAAPATVRVASAARAEAEAARAVRLAANRDGAPPRRAAARRRGFRIPVWFKLLVVVLAGAAVAALLGAQRRSVVEIVSWVLIAAGTIQMIDVLIARPRAE